MSGILVQLSVSRIVALEDILNELIFASINPKSQAAGSPINVVFIHNVKVSFNVASR